MKHIESRRTGLLRLLSQREQTEAVGEQMQIDAARFQELDHENRKPLVISSFNLFQTPEHLALEVAQLVPLRGRILEPSAGLGRLYRAIRRFSDAEITLVEQSPECSRVLFQETEFDDQASLIQEDFLTCDAERLGGEFDAIVMNPPFERGTDIRHIEHARTLLAAGGSLISVCANGPKQRAKYQSAEGVEYRPLPPGSFRSEATSVETALIIIRA